MKTKKGKDSDADGKSKGKGEKSPKDGDTVVKLDEHGNPIKVI